MTGKKKSVFHKFSDRKPSTNSRHYYLAIVQISICSGYVVIGV